VIEGPDCIERAGNLIGLCEIKRETVVSTADLSGGGLSA
jgi:hypothetical protein